MGEGPAGPVSESQNNPPHTPAPRCRPSLLPHVCTLAMSKRDPIGTEREGRMEHPPMASTVFYTNFAKNHNLYRYIESYKERAISSERERERERWGWGLFGVWIEIMLNPVLTFQYLSAGGN